MAACPRIPAGAKSRPGRGGVQPCMLIGSTAAVPVISTIPAKRDIIEEEPGMRPRNDTSALRGDVPLPGHRERLSKSRNCVFAVAESPVKDPSAVRTTLRRDLRTKLNDHDTYSITEHAIFGSDPKAALFAFRVSKLHSLLLCRPFSMACCCTILQKR